jgi:hypothetical protein
MDVGEDGYSYGEEEESPDHRNNMDGMGGIDNNNNGMSTESRPYNDNMDESP